MKIIELRAENVKRISAVAIRPEGNLVEITGRNGQGKTSVLDAIWWAIAGAKHIQSAPIRKGATEAKIEVDLGRLKVRRVFKAKDGGEFTTSLVVENDEGLRSTTPHELLSGLLGALTFDPLAFTRMDAKKQFDALKAFVPDVDFDEIAKANKKDYDRRRDVNRDHDAAVNRLGAFPELPEVKVTFDEAALLSEMEKAAETNADIARRKANREQAERDVASKKAKVKELYDEAERMKAQAEELERQAADLDGEQGDLAQRLKSAGPLPEPIDVTLLRANIEAARAERAEAERRERSIEAREKILTEITAHKAESEALTRRMKDRDEAKAKAVAAAKMPVDGLSFGDGEILLDGVPFDQGSDAEQLRASVAIAAAMAPKLRVIRVRDGSLLDDDSMRLLGELAAERDMQVWVETVASGRAGAVVIEDGAVAGAAVAEAAE